MATISPLKRGRPPLRTADQQNEQSRRLAELEQSIVIAQPHRRGDASALCESPLGRFIIKYALARELYEAGLIYARVRGMWLSAWGAPRDEQHDGSGGEIPEEVARKWRDDSREWFKDMVREGGFDGAMAVQTMCDGYEIRPNAHMLGVIAALAALGKATGKV